MVKIRGRFLPGAFTCVLFFCLATFMFCSSPAAHSAEFGYQGTHILTYGTMDDLARAFERRTGLRVSVRGGGCADGIAAVVNDRLEMGGLCCPLEGGRIEELNLTAHPVARDIKAVIVHPENPLTGIDMKTLRAVHRGEITDWSTLGGKERPIAVVYRRHCLDMDEPVRRILGLNDELSNLTDKAIIVRTDKQLIDYVRRFPTAIGITSRVFAEGKGVKILSVDGVRPTAAGVLEQAYPLTGTLYIITQKEPAERVRRFLRFIGSAEGRSIISRRLAPLE